MHGSMGGRKKEKKKIVKERGQKGKKQGKNFRSGVYWRYCFPYPVSLAPSTESDVLKVLNIKIYWLSFSRRFGQNLRRAIPACMVSDTGRRLPPPGQAAGPGPSGSYPMVIFGDLINFIFSKLQVTMELRSSHPGYRRGTITLGLKNSRVLPDVGIKILLDWNNNLDYPIML